MLESTSEKLDTQYLTSYNERIRKIQLKEIFVCYVTNVWYLKKDGVHIHHKKALKQSRNNYVYIDTQAIDTPLINDRFDYH